MTTTAITAVFHKGVAMPERVSRKQLEELEPILSDRDKNILRSIQAYRYLTTSQIQRLHFIDAASHSAALRATSRNLEKLKELHLIDSLARRIGGIYSGSGSFAGWMRRIFVTTALEYLRQNDALRQSASIEEYYNTIIDEKETVLDKISADDLMDCISKLPDGYRTVFNLYAIEGYSHSEIAGMLEINESTSRSQYMRARNILQKNVQLLIGHENAKQYK